jgi:hypothetical protein
LRARLERTEGPGKTKKGSDNLNSISCSKKLAYCTLGFDCAATGYCLFLCTLCILRSFTGSLPFLTALIAFIQAMTAIVLNAYFGKSKAENTAGGIVFENMKNKGESI